MIITLSFIVLLITIENICQINHHIPSLGHTPQSQSPIPHSSILLKVLTRALVVVFVVHKTPVRLAALVMGWKTSPVHPDLPLSATLIFVLSGTPEGNGTTWARKNIRGRITSQSGPHNSDITLLSVCFSVLAHIPCTLLSAPVTQPIIFSIKEWVKEWMQQFFRVCLF